MKTKKVYFWVKEDGDSSYKLFRNDEFFGENIGAQVDSLAPNDCCGVLALKAKSSILFSSKYAESIDDIPKQSVYGVSKQSASGVNSMKTFKISNKNVKPLVLYSGSYVIIVDYKKKALAVKTFHQGETTEIFHETAQQVQSIQDHSNMRNQIYEIFQKKLDFKVYWERRSEMKGVFDAYHDEYEKIYNDLSARARSAEQSYDMMQSFLGTFDLGFSLGHLFDNEVSYLDELYGEGNKYSRWFKDHSSLLDDHYDRFFLFLWEYNKNEISVHPTPFWEKLASNEGNQLLEGLDDFLKNAEGMPLLEEGEKAYNNMLQMLKIGDDFMSLSDSNQSDNNLIADSSLSSFQNLLSYYKIDKHQLEPIFILLNLQILEPRTQYEVVRIIKKSPFAEIYQEAYDEFRQKNMRYFDVLDLRFTYPKEITSTVLSEQDIYCNYGAFRKTYHFNLSMDQLNNLYSKLLDACLLGADTDIRDLASNLTGKYDGKRRARIVDWKGKKTDLAIMIGVLMDYCDSRDSWSCSERLFSVNGEDIEWRTLNVSYNRHKNQPPRTPNKVVRIMDEVLGVDSTSQMQSGGNTKGE